MTEAEWLACEDRRACWDFVQERATARQVRLFACAVFQFHANWDHRTARPDDDCYDLVVAAERYADGLISALELISYEQAIQGDEEGFDPAFASWIVTPDPSYLGLHLRSWLIHGPSDVSA